MVKLLSQYAFVYLHRFLEPAIAALRGNLERRGKFVLVQRFGRCFYLTISISGSGQLLSKYLSIGA